MSLQEAVANDRAVIGGNNPPPDQQLIALIREHHASASVWLNEVPVITNQEQADRAAAFKKQAHDLWKRGDEQRKTEKEPHKKAAEAIDEKWRPHLAAADRTKLAVDAKLTAWLEAERERQRKEAEAARKAAEEAAERAAREQDRANELLRKAERGELAGTGINTMAALELADQAREEAEKLEADAKRAAEQKAQAGGQYTVGGVKRSVGLRTRTIVVLDLPENSKDKIIGAALAKIVPFLVKHGKLGELREEIGRLANQVYRETEEVAPGCKTIEQIKAV